ncbi:antiviral reverse transcriptase Drt3a [Aquimarina aggregata]|uniref:antiviral reverse transcriptase Drt3a n=1 Tax=Aquimarina aggregata TaxID=1642818 RepID=UPI0024905683|nr:antiviral reverse transcriptase Drt3a [Aquimarina aggregata]
MYNQSFTVETFQEIFDKENRKGKNIETRFKDDFEKSLDVLTALKDTNAKLKTETNEQRKIALFEKKKEQKQEREVLIKQVLLKTAKNISKKKSINLLEGDVHGKQSYKLENSIENFFISKKIQQNLLKSYNIKQSNRYSVLSELVNLLEDGFPKYVIRTDIKSFYESIPQKMLRDKINTDHLLSIKTKEFINKTLDSYNSLTGQTNIELAKGIPRGVGFSAYLSELFMRKIDNKLKKLDDVIYYARYVDDIIILFIPTTKNASRDYLNNYKSQLVDIVKTESNGFLELNSRKTKEYNLLLGLREINLNRRTPNPINFLGYRFGSENSKQIKILLSKSKIDKYKRKIKGAFDSFKLKKGHNRKEAFKLLGARIEYLSTNTKLRNNKDKVFVGIYYSNSFLNNEESLVELQKYLKWYIKRASLNTEEKNILLKHDFVSGYKTKKFILLPLKRKLYRNYNKKGSTNIGVLQYGLIEINSIWK